MKAFAKVVGLLCLASVCAGFVYAANRADERGYEVRQFKEKVHAGDTMDGIASQYYNAKNEKGKSWQEFRHQVMSDNADLTKNGRYLQPGDVIVITARVKVAQ